MEAAGGEKKNPAGPLSGAGMQKMWEQLKSESRSFQSLRGDKGSLAQRAQVEVGGKPLGWRREENGPLKLG